LVGKLTSRKRLVRAAVAFLAVFAVVAECSGPDYPPPPPGVTFGKRFINGGTEPADEVAGSQDVVARFIKAIRAHNADAMTATVFGQARAADAANARSLIQNYASLLNGPITVTFDEEKDGRSRTACLNYPSYPYQLYLFIVQGNNGTDSAHWKTDLGAVQGAPPRVKAGQPTPPPHHDKDSFCQDGLELGAPEVPTDLRTNLQDPHSPVLSGQATSFWGGKVTGQSILYDSAGAPVGESPLGVAANGGNRISFQVPANLIQPGASYRWTMQACVQDSCSPDTPPTTFTAPQATPHPATSSSTSTH
jgi:hypothetical protein